MFGTQLVKIALLLLIPIKSGLCQNPAYHGLQLAQIPHHELAGIDLYLDNLIQFATWCILIALGIPLLKLNLWSQLLSNLF